MSSDDSTASGAQEAGSPLNLAPDLNFTPKSMRSPFAIGVNTLVLSSCDLIGILSLKCRKSNQRSKKIN